MAKVVQHPPSKCETLSSTKVPQVPKEKSANKLIEKWAKTQKKIKEKEAISNTPKILVLNGGIWENEHQDIADIY
jgi:hypothetical protein